MCVWVYGIVSVLGEKWGESYTKKTQTCHLVFPFAFQISYPEVNLFGIAEMF